MKKYCARLLMLIALTALMLATPFAASAQKNKNNREQVRKELHEFKLKFLAQEMSLSEQQQKKFVDVYTRMSQEKHKIYHEARQLERRVKNDKNATEADYARATQAMSQAKIEEGKIDKKYEGEFKKFLSSKQIYKMKQAEEAFRKKLKELKQKKK